MGKWKELYSDLLRYKAEHPGVDIGDNYMSIAEEDREGFLAIFYECLESLVSEKFPDDFTKADELNTHYQAIRNTVKQELNLEDVCSESRLDTFCDNALYKLSRAISGILLDLIRGKTDLEGFESEATQMVRVYFTNFYSEGYDRWGALALIHLLNPKGLFAGKSYRHNIDPFADGDIEPGGYRHDLVPELEPTNKLVFDVFDEGSFLIPHAATWSERAKTFVSVRSRWYKPRWRAVEWYASFEWLDVDLISKSHGEGTFLPNLMINSSPRGANELKMLADFGMIMRPDVVVEFFFFDGWYKNPRTIRTLIIKNEALNPRFGFFIVSRFPVPLDAFNPPETVPTENSTPTSNEIAQLTGNTAIQDNSVGVLSGQIIASLVAKEPVPPSPATTIPVAVSLDADQTTKTTNGNTGNGQAENEKPAEPEPAHPKRPAKRILTLANLAENMHVINAGFDIASLDRIAQALVDGIAIRSQEEGYLDAPIIVRKFGYENFGMIP